MTKNSKKKAVKEWEYKVFKNPPGLRIDHLGDTYYLSQKELELIGKYLGEYRARGRQLAFGFPYFYDMSRYRWLPKSQYKKFLKAVCEALDKPYRPFMIEVILPVKLPRHRYEFPKKMPWDKAKDFVEELRLREERSAAMIDYLEELAKLKEKEKKK